MILDKQTLLSDQQALTVTAVSTNTIDLWNGQTLPTDPFGGRAKADAGAGASVPLFCTVTTALTGGTTVQVQVITSDAANLSTPEVLYETAAIATASLVAGYQFRLADLPPGATKRYLGFNYVITGTYGAGKVTGGVVSDKQTNL